MIREWPHPLVGRGINPMQLEKELSEKHAGLRTLITRTHNNWHARKDEYDFSYEVRETMSGCLTYKVRPIQCPIRIDVPEFCLRFPQLYYTRHLRPPRGHMVVTVENYVPLMVRTPEAFDFFINQPLIRNLAKKHIGMVDLPLLSAPSLQHQLVGHCPAGTTLEQLELLSLEQKVHTVLVVQDPFISYYDVQVVADLMRLVEELGMQPILLPFSPNGRARYIKGFLDRFAEAAKKTSEFLNRVARLNIPMVGVDPALVLCYRDEYKLVLGELRGDFHVLLASERLSKAVETQQSVVVGDEPWYFFDRCTEVTALPDAPAQWATISAHLDTKLGNVSVGYCGMAGTYGHEVKNHQNSLGAYELSWHQVAQRLPRNRCLAMGYPRHSRVRRVEDTGVRHPLQALLETIG